MSGQVRHPSTERRQGTFGATVCRLDIVGLCGRAVLWLPPNCHSDYILGTNNGFFDLVFLIIAENRSQIAAAPDKLSFTLICWVHCDLLVLKSTQSGLSYMIDYTSSTLLTLEAPRVGFVVYPGDFGDILADQSYHDQVRVYTSRVCGIVCPCAQMPHLVPPTLLHLRHNLNVIIQFPHRDTSVGSPTYHKSIDCHTSTHAFYGCASSFSDGLSLQGTSHGTALSRFSSSNPGD